MKTAEAPRIHFRSHYVNAYDGARIRYFDSEEDLPAVLLANGLGGPVSAWHPYFERWRGVFRVLSWDYRGLYGSLLPHRAADLTVRAHARDVAAVLDAAGVETCAVLGWSMGVQVGLQFYSDNPTRVSHLALINGTYGSPLGGVPLPFSHITLPPLVRRARKLHRIGRSVVHAVSRTPLSYAMLRRLRMVAEGLSSERFYEMVEDFREVDLDLYFDLLTHLHLHDAERELSRIAVPTLVMAGSRDLLTPPWLARHIARSVPGAELFVIPGGTHYSAAEYPDQVAARFEQFVRGPSLSGRIGTRD